MVFSTKDRTPLLFKDQRTNIYNYICGIIKSEGGFVYAIGGTGNHIHILCALTPKKSLSEMLQRIKGHSSKWINLQFGTNQKFKWHLGYGVFTVSHSQVEAVKEYVLNQETHHKKMTFKEEFELLLKKHEVEFKEEFIWK